MEAAGIFFSLFDKLASPVLLEFANRQGFLHRLKKLEVNLKLITEVIGRAENTLVRDAELRDWAYDADDFLDEVNTRAMQAEEARRNVTSRTLAVFTKVRDVFPGFIRGKHSKEVDELSSRLGIMNEMCRLRLIKKSTPRQFEAPALSFDPRVFGREREKERIVEQLKSSSGDPIVEVISIVGMPGIGKTTLASHVFDSASLQQQEEAPLFDIYGWVCVSDDFDVIRITRDIFESFTSRAPNSSGLNQLQSELKEVVEGKRFLLVLDDVWNRNYDDWKSLRSPFRVAAPGSKILVTTRDIKVASMMRTDDDSMKIHQLGTLCDDDCWLVFLQHVIDERNPVFESDAGRFRVKILEKCKGLPLTAQLLGGLLRGKRPGQGWEAKLNSSMWDLSEDKLSGGKGYGILSVVMLSYFHLPPELKRCFSYCSVLPKDYEFGEEEVVLLWMAEGLVLPERGGEQVEVRGAKYFRELVSRSLFQPSPNNPSRFLMHDLINDMAEIVAGKSCYKFDGDREIDSIPLKVRYLSYRHFSGLKMEFEAFEAFELTKYLRAFQSFDHIGREHQPSYLTSYVPLKLLMKLKYLRVFCLSGYFVRELPEDIGDLIHLRLVDLSHTYITRLPESTSNLYNLQTLKLKGCIRLRALPPQTRKLVNLRYLDCSGAYKLVAMPVGMGKLTSLQKLSNFIVGKGSENGIAQLKYLPHLKGSISISFLENVGHPKEAREAKLISKGLQSLELKWKMDSDHADLQGRVIEELQPHKHLEKLIINGYGGLWFPGWIGDDSFSKMRVIELADCKKCTSLPPLGKLPVLEEIQIRNMARIKCVGEEFYGKERGAFPSLKILKFEDMENWSTWSYPHGGGRRFACLQELHVINCPKLSMSLPEGINVQKLKVIKCDELSISLPRQPILEMDIRECKVELMKEDGDASQLLPSVISSLMIENVVVVEAVESAWARMNVSSNKDAVEAYHQMMMLGSLTALEIASIPKLTHLSGAVLQGLPKLETLTIRGCEELTSLWKIDAGEMETGVLNFFEKQKSHFLNSLRFLEVEGCCQLVCLVPQRGGEEEDNTDIISEEEEKRGKQQYPGLPCGLETLSIKKCEKLEKLPSDLHNLTSLSELVICYCRRLSCLTEMGFPSALESLFIMGCESLTCFLSISSSSSSSMTRNGMPLPHSLKRLDISNCENLESLVGGIPFTSADSFPLLESVDIRDCPKLMSPPVGSGTHGRLKALLIEGCENLGELPISLPALENLRINGWPAGLLSIQQGGPNPNSLPPNIHHLDIEGGACPSVTPNDEVFSVQLPSSLATLRISKFKKLSPEAFKNLTSLHHLSIENCPELTSIPDQLLPPSLRSLHVEACPLLAPKFAKAKGRYWPKVKFIPDVVIDHVSLFDPEEKRFNRGYVNFIAANNKYF